MEKIPTGYLSPKEASKYLGVSKKTLTRWREAEKIEFIRPGPRKYYYKVESVLPDKERVNYIYARVSTKNQTSNLIFQVKSLQEKYPEHRVLKDVGSGLDGQRQGYQTLLEQASKGLVGELVLTHQDRLTRFGFETIRRFIEVNGGKVLVYHRKETSPPEELVEDLLSIIDSFSSHVPGLRKYKNKISQDPVVSGSETKENL